MAFTGRLGTPNSQFGNIVFAAVDGLGPGTPDFQAHQLTSRSVRLLFSVRVTEGALDQSSYSFASLAAPGLATVPPVESVEYYDETGKSVVVTFSAPLTTGTQYSASVSGVSTLSGDVILGASKNFTANVVDPPRALGAFLSKRGYVDVLFDKPVGPYSSAAVFSLRDASGGPSTAMIQASWAGEEIPETTLRVGFSSAPTAESFLVEFSAVKDYSLNPSAGSIPLTLALRSPTPYSYADLVQVQLTDAFATDVSPDVLRTTNVRVFFSCPVLDSAVPSNWDLSAEAGHRLTDTVDAVSAPPATDEPTLIALVNDLKSVLNGHVTIEQVHFLPASADFVSYADAFDLDSAIGLLNALILSVPSHLLRSRVHSYPDTVNLVQLSPVPAADLPGAISAANVLSASVAGHILPEYPLDFSAAYQPPVGEITAYSREQIPDSCFDVEGPYTYFADLRVLLDSEVPRVLVRASLTSEDGGSTTSPSNYTGDIAARAAAAPLTVRSSLVWVDEWVDLRTDRNVEVLAGSPPLIVATDGRIVFSEASVISTLPVLLWAFNNALEAYRRHILPGAAGHQVDDDINTVGASDYALLPVGAVLSSVNIVREKVLAHMASAVFHYHADPSSLTAPPATDLLSLAALVSDLVEVLAGHLVKVGPHVFPGYRMLSAPVFDVVRLSTSAMADASALRASGRLQDSHVYNGLPRAPAPSEASTVTHVVEVDVPFIGLAVRPSLASAVPHSALLFDEVEGRKFGSDAVEVFFSKRMRTVPLDSSNLPVTGGSIQQKESAWSSPLVASVSVIKMRPVTYSVVAVGLFDEAGNTVY